MGRPLRHAARLRLRPFTEADADAFFTLHSSPDVLRMQEWAPLPPPTAAG